MSARLVQEGAQVARGQTEVDVGPEEVGSGRGGLAEQTPGRVRRGGREELGEAQGVSLTWLAWKTAKPHWFEKGFAKSVIQNGFKKEPDLPNVPMLIDLVKNEDHKKIVRFMATLSPIGRGLAVPPGVPASRVAALRMAFQKTISDPVFLAAAKKRKLRVNGASGEEVGKIVASSMNVPANVIKQAQIMIMGK